MRDYLVDNRIAVVSEDSWGGEITTAAVAHFATSTPEEFLINTTDLMNYNTASTGIGGPWSEGGKLYPGDKPGLVLSLISPALAQPLQLRIEGGMRIPNHCLATRSPTQRALFPVWWAAAL